VLWLRIERVIPKKKKVLSVYEYELLTHPEQGRHAELFFPVLMMNCAD